MQNSCIYRITFGSGLHTSALLDTCGQEKDCKSFICLINFCVRVEFRPQLPKMIRKKNYKTCFNNLKMKLVFHFRNCPNLIITTLLLSFHLTNKIHSVGQKHCRESFLSVVELMCGLTNQMLCLFSSARRISDLNLQNRATKLNNLIRGIHITHN